jgi:hypothetical protein
MPMGDRASRRGFLGQVAALGAGSLLLDDAPAAGATARRADEPATTASATALDELIRPPTTGP